MAAIAEAWLYGIAVPRVGSDASPARSAEIQLSPTTAIRRVIDRARPESNVRLQRCIAVDPG
jgi:hypothetical protein